jgi:predicted acyltransferase
MTELKNTNNRSTVEQSRLLSLDFYRGFTMFLLIAEFTHLFNYLVAPQFTGTIIHSFGVQLHHQKWEGLHFWDLIQPFFTFIVGVAIPLSFSKRIKKGETYPVILKHIAIRSLILLFLGWALYCIENGKIVFLFQNVLAQLSVSIIIAFLIMRKPVITQLSVSIGLLVITELIYRGFWVEGFNQPFIPNHNFGTWFDLMYNGADLKEHWVSFNVFPTTAHTIWGVLAGKLLISDRSNNRKLLILVFAGIIGLIIGYGLSPLTPIIKRIATSTFVSVSGGWSLIALAASFGLIDIMNIKNWVKFFAYVGMNPLFIYLFAHVGGAELAEKIIHPFSSAVFGWTGELGVNIATGSLALFAMWYVCYWMYKRKVFIKI